ncbi:MAG: LacI family DNA-binding transcriptional regulator [Actinomycetes bacterium]
MSRRPTISDVARAAGVSKGAVSFALNGRPGIAPATRERIMRAASELGWTPSHRARALSSSRSLAVGLVVARTPETLGADPFFPAFIAGIESVLAEHGHALVLQVVTDERAEHESYRRLAADGRVDGVFLTDLRSHDSRPSLLTRLGLPAVCVAPRPTWGRIPAVSVDDRPGIAAATHHLIELGHTHIAHVAGSAGLVHGVSRREAWAGALRSAGLPVGPCVVADFSAAGGAAATKELLDRVDPPTAIVYANDLMAIAGMSTAIGCGIGVPADLSITGFDDTEVAAHLQPPLTSVRTDAIGWGRAAALRLLALLDGRDTPEPHLSPPELVVRASTAPPPDPHPTTGRRRPASMRPRTETHP